MEPTRHSQSANTCATGAALYAHDIADWQGAQPSHESLRGAFEARGKTIDGIRSQSDEGHPVKTREIPQNMAERSQAAAGFLKALAHEGRLMILCHLNAGEKSVTELEELLCARQAAVSQQLARLRMDGLVTFRRDGKTYYYSLADGKAQRTIALLYELFCTDEGLSGQKQ